MRVKGAAIAAAVALAAGVQRQVDPFRPLQLPPANAFRDGVGRPGPRYWQQHLSYSIDATLDTATQRLTGRELIRYVNNSPDTLRSLWLQLDQNLYRPDSRGAARFPDLAKGGGNDFHGGYDIDSVAEVGGPPLGAAVQGTLMRVDLGRALRPRDSTMLRLVYRFQIPEHGSSRMGRTRYAGGWMYGIGQWYPRAVVYDDARGWNLDEYLGQGEFYLEYGDIDFAITVPRGFIVAGTGTLVNPAEVLTPLEQRRLAAASRSDTTIAVIGRREAGSPSSRPTGASPTLTWRFAAKNVRDAAWAASPAFVWDASGWKNVLIQAFYETDADPDWRSAATYVRNTIQLYSDKWFRYPYPTATSVAGPNKNAGGMEYPMLVFDPSGYGGRALRSVTLHEVGHQWFPMIVGSNERRYAWMDEGVDTFINDADDWSDHGGFSATGNGDGWVRAIKAGHDGIPMTPADSMASSTYQWASYRKPSMGLYLLRHQIVADTARFDAALREYVHRWAFKHPTPADFFRTMETQLGMDLSWFWRGWFYDTAHVDLAVDSVTVTRNASGARTAHVFLANRGALPMPVPIHLSLVDGTARDVAAPVDVWRHGNTHRFDVVVAADVAEVEIDRNHNIPDIQRSNDAWRRSPPDRP